MVYNRSRSSSVNKVTRLQALRSRFDSRQGQVFFSSPPRPDRFLVPTQSRVLGALSPGVKQPVREADHAPSSVAEVKNSWCCTYTPPYAFMAWCLIKLRDNFSSSYLLWYIMSNASISVVVCYEGR
jgi:hypothetical protein